MKARYAFAFAAGLVLSIGFAAPARGQATLSPNRLLFHCSFGRQCPDQTTTLTNVGNNTVGLISISLSGANFTEKNDCNSSLKPGQSCTIVIGVLNHKPGTFTGVLTVDDTASNSPQRAQLTLIAKQ